MYAETLRNVMKILIYTFISLLILCGIFIIFIESIHKNSVQVVSEPPIEKPTPIAIHEKNAIEVVEDFKLPEPYNLITIGKALENTFQDVNWKMFKDKKYQIVEFSGTITAKELEQAGFPVYDHEMKKMWSSSREKCLDKTELDQDETKIETCVLPFITQFELSDDLKQIHLSYMSVDIFNMQAHPERVLDFIYR